MFCLDCKSLAPIWETVATDFANDKNILIAKVDAEAPNSKATAEEQNVSSYPTIKWFPAGSKEPVAFGAGRTEEDILAWVNEKAGTHRVAGGELDILAGTIASLDSIVGKLTGGVALTDVATEATKHIAGLKDVAQRTYAEYYVRVFDKLSKNEGYAAKELSRLEGILAKGGLVPAKRDEIKTKTNVLRKFLEKVAEKAEEVKDEL